MIMPEWKLLIPFVITKRFFGIYVSMFFFQCILCALLCKYIVILIFIITFYYLTWSLCILKFYIKTIETDKH